MKSRATATVPKSSMGPVSVGCGGTFGLWGGGTFGFWAGGAFGFWAGGHLRGKSLPLFLVKVDRVERLDRSDAVLFGEVEETERFVQACDVHR
mmetsp:Transcript_35390/g.92590  ORF Transcript_35390/g.92590 Transcript_35390/m.92590 type:complete len:93 (-) Transcript_35390:1527-1805(-)